jgi:FkbM family methyltransferase
MIANLLVALFFFWRGKLKLPGAGRLLSLAAIWERQLQSFQFQIPTIGELTVDFRDRSSFCWTSYLLGLRLGEEAHLNVIGRYLRPGSVFWDVGSNVGLVSALVFKNYPTVQIVAIEPNPALAERLEHLFAEHDRVLVVRRALSSSDGEAPFFIPAGASFAGSLDGKQTKAGEFVQVRMSRGDSLLDELSRLSPPALIKIDAEAHEPSVFCGINRIIREHRPTIIFEHDHLSDEKVGALTPRGYRRFSIHRETGQLIDGIDRRSSVDSLLIPIEQDAIG